VEQGSRREACQPGAAGKIRPFLARGGARGVRFPGTVHQHEGTGDRHGTRLTTTCRSAATRAGKGTPPATMDASRRKKAVSWPGCSVRGSRDSAWLISWRSHSVMEPARMHGAVCPAGPAALVLWPDADVATGGQVRSGWPVTCVANVVGRRARWGPDAPKSQHCEPGLLGQAAAMSQGQAVRGGRAG